MDKKTIRVNESAFETAKERKEAQGQTWDEYLTDTNRTGPDANDVASEITATLNLDASEAKGEIQDVKEQIEEVQSMLESAQESWEYLNGEEIHGTVHETDEMTKDIVKRIDDLENTLPRKVAQEVRQG